MGAGRFLWARYPCPPLSRIPTPRTLQILNPEPWTLNPQPSTLNPQPSTLNPEPSTLNPQPSTLSPQPSTLNPQPSTLNPNAERELSFDNLLVRIHLNIEMILVDRPCAMGV